jgi:hypothetical protein
MTHQTASPSPAPQAARPGLYQQGSSGYHSQATPVPAAQSPFPATQQLAQTPSYQASNITSRYGAATPTQPYQQRQTIQQVQAQAAAQQQQQQHVTQPAYPPAVQAQTYNQYPTATAHERHHEAYILSTAANETIPKDIRDRFQQDDEGHVLFFTKPPMDTSHIVSGRGEHEKGKQLQHTKAYLDAKAIRDEQIREKKRKLQGKIETNKADNNYKRLKPGHFGEARDADGRIKPDPIKAAQIRAEEDAKVAAEWKSKVSAWNKHFEDLHKLTIQESIDDAERRWGRGQHTLDMLELEAKRQEEREVQWAQERVLAEQARGKIKTKDEETEEDTRRMLSQNRWTGRFYDGTGRFEDDYDNRLLRPQ